ncbi:MAG: zinc-binding alcohol dehydrogenase [Chloroflexota bacterium]
MTPSTSETNRALWFSGRRAVEVRERPPSAPGANEVCIRAVASAISHGTEMLVYRGQVPDGTTLDLPTLEGSFNYPIKYGYALAGIVESVGHGVQGLSVGQPVFALNPHESRPILDAAWPRPLPSDVPIERGVFAASVETAANCLLDYPPRLGEDVVVLGLGTVGTLVGVLARRAGARRLIGVDAVGFRRSAALELGFTHAVPPSTSMEADIRSLLGERRPDIVYEASANAAATQAAIDLVADHGLVCVVSWYGTKPVPLVLGGRFHRGRIGLVSTQVGQINPALRGRWDHDRRWDLVKELLRELPLERLISHRFPLADASRAYALIDEGADSLGQVVLTY